MSRELKPLAVGDRVRVYCSASRVTPMFGEITRIHGEMLDVKIGKNPDSVTYWCGFPQQVRRLRKKERPKSEERVERWLYMDSYGKEKCVDSRSHCEAIAKRTDADVAYVRLVELREGETIVNVKKLIEETKARTVHWENIMRAVMELPEFKP